MLGLSNIVVVIPHTPLSRTPFCPDSTTVRLGEHQGALVPDTSDVSGSCQVTLQTVQPDFKAFFTGSCLFGTPAGRPTVGTREPAIFHRAGAGRPPSL